MLKVDELNLVARMPLLLKAFLIGILIGILACGPSAPYQESEDRLSGVTAAPQDDATEEPQATEEPTTPPTSTPTPSPTPLPTICLDLQDHAGTITPICRTKTDDTPHRFYKLASQTLQELADEYDTEQSTEGDSGSRGARGTEGEESTATGPLVHVMIEVHTEEDLVPIISLLKSANRPPLSTWNTAVEARFPASPFAANSQDGGIIQRERGIAAFLGGRVRLPFPAFYVTTSRHS